MMVRHRDEGGDAGEGLGTPVGAMGGEAEVSFETGAKGQMDVLFESVSIW